MRQCNALVLAVAILVIACGNERPPPIGANETYRSPGAIGSTRLAVTAGGVTYEPCNLTGLSAECSVPAAAVCKRSTVYYNDVYDVIYACTYKQCPTGICITISDPYYYYYTVDDRDACVTPPGYCFRENPETFIPPGGFGDGGVIITRPDAGPPDAGVRADGGAPDAGVTTPDAGVADAGTLLVDAGLPDAGVSIPDAGTVADAGVIADAGTSVPDAGTTTPDAGVAPADGGTVPTVPPGVDGVVHIVIDASRVLCANAHIAAFGNVSNFSIPLENGTLSLDVNITYAGTMDTTLHCGSHTGSLFALDYTQYGASCQTARQFGYREITYYPATGVRKDLLDLSFTKSSKLVVPLKSELGTNNWSTVNCP